MKREKDDVLGEAEEQDSDGSLHRDEIWNIPAHNDESFYYGPPPYGDPDDFYESGGDPAYYIREISQPGFRGGYIPTNPLEPSPRKPPKRKRIPEDDEKTKGGKRKGGQKQRQRGRGSATDTFPDSSPPPDSPSVLDLVNSRVKPSKRGKPSRAARARARARGEGLYATKDDWKYMGQDEKDAYLQELAKRPPAVAEILLKALPPEAREAGEKRDDESEQYNVYGDADRNDDDAQDEHRDSDIDDDGNDEESEPSADSNYTEDETEDDINHEDTENHENGEDGDEAGGGDDESFNEPDAQQDYYFGEDSQDSDNHESSESETELDESQAYRETEYSPDQDFEQNFNDAAWGEVDSEGADDAQMADADVDGSSDADTGADGDADSGGEYDIDIDFDGIDMDWDMDIDYGEFDSGDWGDFDIDMDYD